MEPVQDPKLLLAQRLRALREDSWPHTKVTQPQLAMALGVGKPISVSLISSWESTRDPKLPPIPRLEAYATFFATRRSIDGDTARLLHVTDLTPDEAERRDELARELLRLRRDAMRLANPLPDDVLESLTSGYWHFADGKPITLVSAQLPDYGADRAGVLGHTGSDFADPNVVARVARPSPRGVPLSAYADLDALVELHGHVRAANPGTDVNLQVAPLLDTNDYTAHLISLGGVDWNIVTRKVLAELDLPVRQVADWDTPEGPYFEVTSAGGQERFYPRMDRTGGREELLEDVALFVWAVNPWNRKRSVTVCNGMYASGTYGLVRALTDERFRDRNTEYAREAFKRSSSFCILVRVSVNNGIPLTPDWSLAENRLFEWSSES